MTLQADKRPWYKERWPWLLMSGPAIVVVAGIATAYLAVTSSDGLVTDDYYKQGLAVNQSLHRNHNAEKLGVHADIMRAGANLRLILAAQPGTALPDSLMLKLAHPTRAGMDEDVVMKAEGHGFYSGKLNGDPKGRWLVLLEDASGEWRLQGEWQADSGEPLRLGAMAEK